MGSIPADWLPESGEIERGEIMNDRRNPDQPEDPNEERPPEVGEDPGMVGREPVRREARDEYAQETEVPTERSEESEVPTEVPTTRPGDVDATADPLPYRGQSTEVDQPFQSTGMPVNDPLHGATTYDTPGEDPQRTGTREPTTPGTDQPPATRGDRTVWLLIIIAAVVFCIVVLALIIGGVFT
jgi:hypothetical protein